jgi:hypothetical protein
MKHLQRSNLRYPGLWRGCVGAWAPCLGPTGLTLRDWSGRGNHGTLTNMDAAGDWVISGGRYALDFDGSNDYVDVPSVTLPTNAPWTVSFWLRVASFHTTYPAIMSFNTSDSVGWLVFLSTTEVNYRPISFGSYLGALATTRATTDFSASLIGTWTHIAISYVGTSGTLSSSFRMFRNGVSEAVTASGLFGAHNNTGRFGTSANTGFFMLGNLDGIMVHHRQLSAKEISVLASRRGIAYETNRNRQYNSAATAARLCNIFTGNSLEIIGAP